MIFYFQCFFGTLLSMLHGCESRLWIALRFVCFIVCVSLGVVNVQAEAEAEAKARAEAEAKAKVCICMRVSWCDLPVCEYVVPLLLFILHVAVHATHPRVHGLDVSPACGMPHGFVVVLAFIGRPGCSLLSLAQFFYTQMLVVVLLVFVCRFP